MLRLVPEMLRRAACRRSHPLPRPLLGLVRWVAPDDHTGACGGAKRNPRIWWRRDETRTAVLVVDLLLRLVEAQLLCGAADDWGERTDKRSSVASPSSCLLAISPAERGGRALPSAVQGSHPTARS